MTIDGNEHLLNLDSEVKKKLISDINYTAGLKILYWTRVGWPCDDYVWASITIVENEGVYKPLCTTIRFDDETKEFYYMNKYI